MRDSREQDQQNKDWRKQDSPKHDWQEQNWRQTVRDRIESSLVPAHDREEVIAELAAHLEETCQDARARGLDEIAAVEFTLQSVTDWPVLAAEIGRAKSKEDAMNQRTGTVLLPTIAVLFAFGLVLLFLDRAVIVQRLIWLACTALLFCAIASEADRLSLRAKSFWLPGFVSLTAASLFLFAEEIVLTHDSSFYFTDISLRPHHLVSGLPFWFYLLWLLAQVLCGSLGAFLSRRGGGSRVARIAAGAFPAMVMFGLCAVVIPLSALSEHNSYVLSHPSGLALGVLIWSVAPAVALLLGAAPFLQEPMRMRRHA